MNPTFIWWKGVVEDRNDPLELGRCRVRILGYHTDDKDSIPTNSLPFAYPAMPINTRPGDVPVGPVEGTWVMGFFVDGESAQQPIMTHIIDSGYVVENNSSKGFNDPTDSYPSDGKESGKVENKKTNEVTTNRLARGDTDDTYVSNHEDNGLVMLAGADDPFSANIGKYWKDPGVGYSAKYPYNKVEESQSGHVFETDDTPKKERLSRVHKSGTLEVVYSDDDSEISGNRVVKVVGSNFEIVVGDDHKHSKNTINISADADINIKSGKVVRLDGDQVRINGRRGVLLQSPVGVWVSAPFLSTDPKLGGAIMHGATGSPFVAPAGLAPDAIMPDVATSFSGDTTTSTTTNEDGSTSSSLDVVDNASSSYNVLEVINTVIKSGFEKTGTINIGGPCQSSDFLSKLGNNLGWPELDFALTSPVKVTTGLDASGRSIITDILDLGSKFSDVDISSLQYKQSTELATGYLTSLISDSGICTSITCSTSCLTDYSLGLSNVLVITPAVTTPSTTTITTTTEDEDCIEDE